MCGRGVLPVLCILLFLPARSFEAVSGRVIDAVSGLPIAGANVTSASTVLTTDGAGRFQIEAAGDSIGIRAVGYLRTAVNVRSPKSADLEIHLVPFRPKALYLSVFGIGSVALREPALRLLGQTELNSLVIDVKGDRGLIPYRTAIPLAAIAGANRILTIKDVKELVAALRARGTYLIARIVVFKDHPVALARPDLAVLTANNTVWRDREGLAWTDPFKREVWEYNLDIAVESAQNGFDEIQFDYVRFPDAVGLKYSVANTQENRVRAIAQFFEEARKRLARYNVFLSAAIFGYVCWNLNDTYIGQKLETMMAAADYVCPMLYPSGFQYGIPGFRIPVAYPYEIPKLSLERARERTCASPLRFRPWLQAFRDYAFDHRVFGPAEVRSQIRAAEEFGSDGWMLWNPHNTYSGVGLQPKGLTELPPLRTRSIASSRRADMAACNWYSSERSLAAFLPPQRIIDPQFRDLRLIADRAATSHLAECDRVGLETVVIQVDDPEWVVQVETPTDTEERQNAVKCDSTHGQHRPPKTALPVCARFIEVKISVPFGPG